MPTLHSDIVPNYAGGRWETPDGPTQDVRNPGDRRGARPRPAVGGRPTSTRPSPPRPQALRRLAAHAAGRPHPVPVQAEGAARGALRGASPRTITDGMRQDRWPRRAASCAAASRTSRSPAGIPTLMQGSNLEDIARGIDETDDPPAGRRRRRDHAVQFPGHDPALVPALRGRLRQLPSSSSRRRGAADHAQGVRADRPGRVSARRVNLVNGGKDAVDALLDHPQVRAICFVGSTPVARYVYAPRRRQRQARPVPGRRQEPDRRPARRRHGDDRPTIVADSAFGCAGQRCLAVSVAITVGDARETFTPTHRATRPRPQGRLRPGRRRRDGAGDHRREPRPHRGADRRGRARRGARSLRRRPQPGDRRATSTGNFVRPTILDDVADPRSELARTRDLRPGAVAVMHVGDGRRRHRRRQRVGRYGNMACLFTSSGAAARKFRYEARTRQRRHQHRRGRADGLLPVQRLEGQLLRRPARAGPRRHRVLHGEEGRRRALAGRMVAPVLSDVSREETGSDAQVRVQHAGSRSRVGAAAPAHRTRARRPGRSPATSPTSRARCCPA